MLIFWTTFLKPFKAKTGMRVSPAPCELIDGRTGYCLGADWREEIEAKGVEVEEISKEQIKQESE